MKTLKYYFGVYKDYSDNQKIAQLCLSVDDLSCEILANPGCITFYASSKTAAITRAKQLAKQEKCTHFEKGWGSYQLIKVK
jgi:hypothetical protein